MQYRENNNIFLRNKKDILLYLAIDIVLALVAMIVLFIRGETSLIRYLFVFLASLVVVPISVAFKIGVFIFIGWLCECFKRLLDR